MWNSQRLQNITYSPTPCHHHCHLLLLRFLAKWERMGLKDGRMMRRRRVRDEWELWKESYNRVAGAIRGNLVISPHSCMRKCTHTQTQHSHSCYLTLHHAALHLHTSTRLCSLNLSALLCFNGIKWLELTKEERECCQLPQWGHSHTGSCFHPTTMNMALTLLPSQQSF